MWLISLFCDSNNRNDTLQDTEKLASINFFFSFSYPLEYQQKKSFSSFFELINSRVLKIETNGYMQECKKKHEEEIANPFSAQSILSF